MNYISFRGVRSDGLGLLIAEMPSHKRAKQRYTEYEIPGRDGPLHITEGYGAFDLQVIVTMLNAEAALRQTVNAWADGSGDLFTSDDTGKCFRASVFDEVKYGRRKWGGKFCDTARIIFRCQPFMYETIPKQYTFTKSGTIVNLGNLPSLPIITVTGSGNCSFSIAGQSVTLTGVSAPVTLDCEAGYASTKEGAVTMQGSFPEIPLQDSQIVLGSGVTKLEIKGNWRWL